MSSSCGLMPEADRQRALRVEVDEQHLAAVLGQRGAQVDRGRRLADAALLVAHRDDPGRAVRGQRRRRRGSPASAGRSARAADDGPVQPVAGVEAEVGASTGVGRVTSGSMSPSDAGASVTRSRARVESAFADHRSHVAPVTARLRRRVADRSTQLRGGARRAAHGSRQRRAVSAERARMRRGVHLAQLVGGDQRVDLRGGHRGVAEQLLDDAHVGAAVEQVGGERVPQRVRRDRGAPASARSAAATCSTAQALCRDSRPPRAFRNTRRAAAARAAARAAGRAARTR